MPAESERTKDELLQGSTYSGIEGKISVAYGF